jgi:hypothetical protein
VLERAGRQRYRVLDVDESCPDEPYAWMAERPDAGSGDRLESEPDHRPVPRSRVRLSVAVPLVMVIVLTATCVVFELSNATRRGRARPPGGGQRRARLPAHRHEDRLDGGARPTTERTPTYSARGVADAKSREPRAGEQDAPRRPLVATARALPSVQPDPEFGFERP